MISDVLSDSVDGMDRYLENPFYNGMYSGNLRERIVKLRGDMVAMRQELDTPPGAQPTAPTPVVRKIQIACPYCGSNDVSRDAAARWNVERQEWVITNLQDSGGCDSCDSELKSFEEVEL